LEAAQIDAQGQVIELLRREALADQFIEDELRDADDLGRALDNLLTPRQVEPAQVETGQVGVGGGGVIAMGGDHQRQAALAGMADDHRRVGQEVAMDQADPLVRFQPVQRSAHTPAAQGGAGDRIGPDHQGLVACAVRRVDQALAGHPGAPAFQGFNVIDNKGLGDRQKFPAEDQKVLF